MKRIKTKRIIVTVLGCLLGAVSLQAQQNEWTLAQCIEYALNENIQVRKADVSSGVGEINLQQARDDRWPNLSASAGESLGWKKVTDENDVSLMEGSSRTSMSVGSSVTSLQRFTGTEQYQKSRVRL